MSIRECVPLGEQMNEHENVIGQCSRYVITSREQEIVLKKSVEGIF